MVAVNAKWAPREMAPKLKLAAVKLISPVPANAPLTAKLPALFKLMALTLVAVKVAT